MRWYENCKKKEVEKTKISKKSTTDPDSGWYCKGEKEKQFAYSAHIGVDEYGYVVGVKTTPGNIHDSQAFKGLYSDINNRFKDKITGIAVDSAYKTGPICKTIIENNHLPHMPYKKSPSKEGFFKKYEYIYDEYFNQVICPNDKLLNYKRTNKNGYLLFESNPNDCYNCPLKHKCTNQKKKQFFLHIYHKYLDITENLRFTDYVKEVYKKRSMTVERRFGDAKEKHHAIYTHYRGIEKVSNDILLLFTSMNIKKMARRLSIIS